ncbi:MAG TPA: hypothetical protein VGM88_10045 [Kofleriaceae bacterium]|jgi:hypothetical protein
MAAPLDQVPSAVATIVIQTFSSLTAPQLAAKERLELLLRITDQLTRTMVKAMKDADAVDAELPNR